MRRKKEDAELKRPPIGASDARLYRQEETQDHRGRRGLSGHRGMGRRTGDSHFVSARCNEKNRPKNRWMTRSADRSGFAISEALTIKIASWPEPILGPEPRHDLRVQRTYGSSCGDDFVFMGGINAAEPDLAQRPAGTHRRRLTLTGPRLQPKGPFSEPSNGRARPICSTSTKVQPRSG
jgi:hypothetical protein